MRAKIILVTTLFCIGGCASPTLTPIPSSDQIVEYHSGKPTIISRKTNVVVAGLITNEVEDHAIVYIGARNNSSVPATLGTENVAATSGTRSLEVFSYESLVRHEKVRAAWQGVALGMSAGARAAAAAQPSQTYVQGSVYGSGGYYGQYSGSAATSDPAAIAVAQSAINADTRAQAEQLNAANAERMNQLSWILRTTTVHPGQFAGGVVEINNRRMRGAVRISVDFAGETHRFAFQLSK